MYVKLKKKLLQVNSDKIYNSLNTAKTFKKLIVTITNFTISILFPHGKKCVQILDFKITITYLFQYLSHKSDIHKF